MIKYHLINPEGYKYRLKEPVIFQSGIKGIMAECPYVKLYPTGELALKTGFCWDGSSSISIDTDSNMDAACAHDGGYRLLKLGAIPKKQRAKCRKAFDKMMRRLYKKYSNQHHVSKLDKTKNAVRRSYHYWGVRFFAGYAAKEK